MELRSELYEALIELSHVCPDEFRYKGDYMELCINGDVRYKFSLISVDDNIMTACISWFMQDLIKQKEFRGVIVFEKEVAATTIAKKIVGSTGFREIGSGKAIRQDIAFMKAYLDAASRGFNY